MSFSGVKTVRIKKDKIASKGTNSFQFIFFCNKGGNKYEIMYQAIPAVVKLVNFFWLLKNIEKINKICIVSSISIFSI